MAPIRCSDNLQLERSNYRSEVTIYHVPARLPCYPSPPPPSHLGTWPGIENFCRFPSFRPAASLLSSHPLPPPSFARWLSSFVQTENRVRLASEAARGRETPSRAESSLKHMKGVATSPTDARNERKKTKERVRSFLFLSYSRSPSLSPFLPSVSGGWGFRRWKGTAFIAADEAWKKTDARKEQTDGRTDGRTADRLRNRRSIVSKMREISSSRLISSVILNKSP